MIEQAVRNAADYWSTHDGSAMSDTEANRIKWAKNRINGVQITLNEAYVTNANLNVRAVKVSKNIQFNLPDGNNLSEEQILSGFDQGKLETVASMLMDMYGEDINMTIGGN